ncbi:MAG TPA: DUF559 domain-containing protein [Acidimicrobiia bacterium]|nr:DUF559 domain-containing protein [Acidimicrobiia bacterium]
MNLDAIEAFARSNYGLVDRPLIHESGGSDAFIRTRVDRGFWTPIHAGVYHVGLGNLTWLGQLRAATLAAGPSSLISHRTAAQLWGLEGIIYPRIEVTVPNGHLPIPDDILVHRTRRLQEGTVVEGIPVTTVERTILDCAWYLALPMVEQLYDSAIRKRLTTSTRIADCVGEFGKKGVRGRSRVLRVLDDRRSGGLLGSPAESRILRKMRLAGIEEPERQYVVHLADGTIAVLDFAWPRPVKAVEIDGLEAHSSAKQLESDLTRQNLLFEIGWKLRRFTGRAVYRNPDFVVAEIARFLAA